VIAHDHATSFHVDQYRLSVHRRLWKIGLKHAESIDHTNQKERAMSPLGI